MTIGKESKDSSNKIRIVFLGISDPGSECRISRAPGHGKAPWSPLAGYSRDDSGMMRCVPNAAAARSILRTLSNIPHMATARQIQ
jgi:hypothetical protein